MSSRLPGSRPGRALAAAAVAAILTGPARAYNDDPDVDSVFPSWSPTEPVTRPLGLPIGAVFCEVRRTGPHAGEVHFRNVSKVPWHFDFWIAGHQRCGDNARVTLPPYFVTNEELRVPVALGHGRPGLRAQEVRVFDIRRGETDGGPVEAPRAEVADPPVPDEDWMPVRPLYDDAVVRRSELQARVLDADGMPWIEFRNPSFRDLFLAFEVPRLGRTKSDGPRVHVPAKGAARVPLRGADAPVRDGPDAGGMALPRPLLTVVVCDVRAGEKDEGHLHAEDLRAFDGWFPVETADGSDAIPPERVLCTLEPDGRDRARVRFRNRLGSEIRFRFTIPGWEPPDSGGTSVTVAPGAGAEASVLLTRPADGRLSLTRLRVVDVTHEDHP